QRRDARERGSDERCTEDGARARAPARGGLAAVLRARDDGHRHRCGDGRGRGREDEPVQQLLLEGGADARLHRGAPPGVGHAVPLPGGGGRLPYRTGAGRVRRLPRPRVPRLRARLPRLRAAERGGGAAGRLRRARDGAAPQGAGRADPRRGADPRGRGGPRRDGRAPLVPAGGRDEPGRSRGHTGSSARRPPAGRRDHGPRMSRARLGGRAAITLTSILWGTTGTAATFAPGVGPLAIGAAALGIGGLLQAAIALPAMRRAGPSLRRHRAVVLLGALAVALYPLAFYSSMHLAGVAVGSAISLASAPLASGLLERWADRAPLSRWWMLAAGLGIAGSLALCTSTLGARTAAAAPTALGIGLGLVAGATYATFSWSVHRLLTAGIARPAAMGSVFGAGGALLLPVLLLTGAPLVASAQNLVVAGYMALV